jgi:predicted RNase H-like HicB family nuclease
MRSEIIFIVEEDIEGGYTARAFDYPIFTEADTIEELKEKIKDAIRCHFDDEEETPKIVRLHIVKDEILHL